MLRLLLAGALLALPLAAQQQPTAAEMAFIYELNRARSNPQAYDTENSLGGILNGVAARPPLALNLNLVQSARFHSDEMATNGYFAHTSPITGDQPNKLARDAGYPLVTSWPDAANYIESLAALYSSGTASYSAPAALKALIIDAGVPGLGHRIHLLGMDSFAAAFREVGTGYDVGLGNGWPSGAYWSIHTGRRNSDPVWLTGVVYNDANSNGRYDQGEGLSGVTVTATGSSVKNTTSTTGGGWSIDVSAGAWALSCSGGAFLGTATANVNVAADNIAVDFESGTAAGEVGFGNQTPGPGPGGGGSGGGDDDGGGGGCVSNGAGTAPAVFALLAVLAALMRIRKSWRSKRLRPIASRLDYTHDPESAEGGRKTPWAASGVDMKRAALLVAIAAAFALSGCTFFQDDIYRVQSGQSLSDDYDKVDAAIHDEFADRFGKDAVFRADVEKKYNHWTAISEQRAFGHDKYRTRVMAYPQLDADGMYEPVVIVKQEVYTGASSTGRGGPTAMYSNKWSEVGRDADLETDLANAIYKRARTGAKGTGAGGK